MAELKPCPFCGGTVKIEEEWADAVSVFYSFNCDSCGMYCVQNECVPQNEAIEAWNRRAEVVHGRWEEIGVADYKCSRCGFRFTSADPISMFQYCRCGANMDDFCSYGERREE